MSPFDQLLEALGRQNDQIALSVEGPGHQFGLAWFGPAADASAAAAELGAEGLNVWYGINVLGKRPEKGRGKDEDITLVRVLAADFDDKSMPPGVQGTVIRALGNILGTPPTAIVATGGGRQPYWVLSEPMDAELGAMLLGIWKRVVQAVAIKHGAKADSVFDLSRVLRVPGPQNLKAEYGPGGAPTGVVFPGGAPLHNDGVWGALLAVVPPEEIIERGPAKPFEKVAPGTGSVMDDMKSRLDIDDLVEQAGGQRLFTDSSGCVYWRRPGKREGQSGTTHHKGSDRFKCFTSNWGDFEQDAVYDAVDMFAVMNGITKNDFDAIVKAGAAAGYGGTNGGAEHVGDEIVRKAQEATAARTAAELTAAQVVIDNPFADPLAVLEAQARIEELSISPTTAKRFYYLDELDAIVPPVPLMEGILDVNSTAMLAGRFGTYKSFVALAWSLHVASGTDWCGHKVPHAATVIYVAAEGTSGMHRRAKAWLAGHPEIKVDPKRFVLFPHAVKLTNPEAMKELFELVLSEDAGLVVFDTFHKMTPGLEENSARDMGEAMGAVEAIRDATGISVLYLHHTGHIGTRSRGSSSLEDDIDISWVIELEDGDDRGPENRRILSQRKVKDGEVSEGRALLFIKQLDSGYVDVSPIELRKKMVENKKLDQEKTEARIQRDILMRLSKIGGGPEGANFIIDSIIGGRGVKLQQLPALESMGLIRMVNKKWELVSHAELSLTETEVREQLLNPNGPEAPEEGVAE